jgi:hypothetical protein
MSEDELVIFEKNIRLIDARTGSTFETTWYKSVARQMSNLLSAYRILQLELAERDDHEGEVDSDLGPDHG